MLNNDSKPANASPVIPGAPSGNAGGKKAKPSTTFITQSSDTTFVATVGRILAGMAGHPAYPSPVPALEKVAAAHEAFVAAVSDNDRGRRAIATRDKTRRQAEALVGELALYVAQRCQGDLVTLLGSGFPARRTRGPRRQLAPHTPGVRKVGHGPASGQVVGRCEKVEGALVYQWRFAPAQAPSEWTLTDGASTTRVTLENLVPGTQYLVQVRATGRRGSSDWSDAIAVIAV